MFQKRIGGMAGIFLDEHVVVDAARKVREAGFSKFDAISPFPLHGIEEAIGITRSVLPYFAFGAACVGLGAGLLLTWWTSVISWPINVGGKPFFSLPAFIPIMFELTILFSALTSVAALFYYCKLPQFDPPVIDPDLTSHKFAIFIPQNETGYDENKISSLLKDLGAVEVKKVAEY